MTAIKTFFTELWMSVYTLLSSVNILTSVADILLVALVVFALIRLIRDSRAEQLFKGILLLVVAYGAATLFQLKTLQYLLSILFDNALILVVVIFQQEIRRALEQAGSSRFGFLRAFGENREAMTKAWKNAISATVKAVAVLQEQRTGALIVFERQTKLGDIVTSGTLLEAQPSPELLGNIFFKNTPLHDGAVILREGRVCAAGCILPLTDLQIGTSMGTRHRAAVGMSENSDAVVVVVSEETGTISVAQGGVLRRDFTPEELKSELESAMFAALQKDEPRAKKNRFAKRRGGK